MGEMPWNVASRWKRFVGVLIDGLISMLVMLPIMVATGYLQQVSGGEQITIGQRAAYFLVGWGLFVLINGYFLLNRGQTIGKVVIRRRL